MPSKKKALKKFLSYRQFIWKKKEKEEEELQTIRIGMDNEYQKHKPHIIYSKYLSLLILKEYTNQRKEDL